MEGRQPAIIRYFSIFILSIGLVVSTALWAGALQTKSMAHDSAIIDHEGRLKSLEVKEQELRTTLQGMKDLLYEIKSDVKEIKKNGGKK